MLSNAALQLSGSPALRTPSPAPEILGGSDRANTLHVTIRARKNVTRPWGHVAETLTLALISATGMGLALTAVVDILHAL